MDPEEGFIGVTVRSGCNLPLLFDDINKEGLSCS